MGFKFDLLELVSAILVGPVGSGGYIESHLAVDLVGVVGIAEDGDDFPLQLGAGLIGLNVFAAEDEVHNQRRGYRNKQPKRRSLAGR